MSYLWHYKVGEARSPLRRDWKDVTTACGIKASFRPARQGETGTFGAPIQEGTWLAVYPEVNVTNGLGRVSCGRCKRSKVFKAALGT